MKSKEENKRTDKNKLEDMEKKLRAAAGKRGGVLHEKVKEVRNTNW